jgi:hypothetical protein
VGITVCRREKVVALRHYSVQVHATFGWNTYLVAELIKSEFEIDRALFELRQEYPEANYEVTARRVVWVASRVSAQGPHVLGVFEAESDANNAALLADSGGEEEATVAAYALT